MLMPETTVHKEGEPMAGKNEIWISRKVASVKAKPEP
jgi:hypothetical protein